MSAFPTMPKTALSHSARLAADLLEARPEGRHKTVLLAREVQDVVGTRHEAVRALKELEDANFGVFVVGRRGGKSRLEQTAQQRERLLQALNTDAPETSAESNPESPDPVSRDATYVHSFRLREDFLVSIELPADFSSNEATRLGTFLDSLPMT